MITLLSAILARLGMRRDRSHIQPMPVKGPVTRAERRRAMMAARKAAKRKHGGGS